MTHEEYVKRRDDIVERFTDYEECEEWHIHDGSGEHEGYTPQPHDFDDDKLKKAIDQLFLDVVGENKPAIKTDDIQEDVDVSYVIAQAENYVRTELRAIINGGE